MRILVSYLHTDHTASLTGAPQQFLGLVHPKIRQILDKGLARLLAEDHTQMIR